MEEVNRIPLLCKCGHDSRIYRGLYQSEAGEIVATWRCIKCKESCVAVIAGFKPVNQFYSEQDIEFLKSCNVEIPCSEQ